MEVYEVLHIDKDNIDNYIYYIRHYPDGLEHSGLGMRLSEKEFKAFTTNKVEV